MTIELFLLADMLYQIKLHEIDVVYTVISDILLSFYLYDIFKLFCYFYIISYMFYEH